MENLTDTVAEFLDKQTQVDAFTTQCKAIEDRHKSELNDAKAGLMMFLSTQPVSRLPDGTFLRIHRKESSRVITTQRIEKAVDTMDEPTMAAFHDALEEACTVVTEAPVISSDAGEVPESTYIKAAPKQVLSLCKQMAEADAALKRVRKHKKEGKKRVGAVLSTLQDTVGTAYNETTGTTWSEATAGSTGLKPPVINIRPPCEEDEELPTVPDAPITAGGTLDIEADTVTAPVRVRVKETKAKSGSPKRDAYLETLSQHVTSDAFDTEQFKELALKVFNELKMSNKGSTKRTLCIEALKPRKKR